MIDDKAHHKLTDEVPGRPIVRSRFAADRLARRPVAKAALEFASARHANQYRSIDHAPFIAHPIEVGWLLDCDGQPDEVIAAGLLNDTLEKTATTSAELRRRFGARVAGLVESVSADLSIGDPEQRKRQLRDRVAHVGSGSVAIFAADKISKVRELALLPASALRETSARAKLGHYQGSLEMLRRVARRGALVDRLDAELSRLLARTDTGTRTARATKTREPSNSSHRRGRTNRRA